MELGQDDRVVFHGTSAVFDAFELDRTSVGGDENSALGIFCSDLPADAVEYAEAHAKKNGGEPRVLAVFMTTECPYTDFGYYAFFGYDEAGNQVMDREGFRNIRDDLIYKGYDSVEYDDGEQTICVGFFPERARIAAVMTCEQAVQLSQSIEQLEQLEGIYDDNARAALLFDMMQVPLAAPGSNPSGA